MSKCYDDYSGLALRNLRRALMFLSLGDMESVRIEISAAMGWLKEDDDE